MAVIFVWVVGVDFSVGISPDAHLVSYSLVGAALLVSGLAVSHAGFTCNAAAQTGLVVVAASDVLGRMNGGPWRACDQFKCSSLGALFRGPFPSENTLSLLATMTLAWTATATTGRVRLSGCALCVATIFATGSRTGLIVSALILVVVPLVRGLWRERQLPQVQDLPWWLACSAAASVVGVGTYLLYAASRSTFSTRGLVWAEALAKLRGHTLFGRGLSSYSVYQNEGIASQHFTHSEYLLLLFAGGYVAIGLFFVWGAVTMRAIARSERSVAAAVPVLAFMVYGYTEATWNPLGFDAFAWIALALSLTVRGDVAVDAAQPALQRVRRTAARRRAFEAASRRG